MLAEQFDYLPQFFIQLAVSITRTQRQHSKPWLLENRYIFILQSIPTFIRIIKRSLTFSFHCKWKALRKLPQDLRVFAMMVWFCFKNGNLKLSLLRSIILWNYSLTEKNLYEHNLFVVFNSLKLNSAYSIKRSIKTPESDKWEPTAPNASLLPNQPLSHQAYWDPFLISTQCPVYQKFLPDQISLKWAEIPHRLKAPAGQVCASLGFLRYLGWLNLQ